MRSYSQSKLIHPRNKKKQRLLAIVAPTSSGCHFLGSGFFGFWVLGIILNFPEPPFLAREFPRTLANFPEPKKSPRVCASAEHNTTTSCCVVHAYSVSAQAQSTTRLLVLCRSRIRRSTRLLVHTDSCIVNNSAGLLSQPL
jgi:hypothetical protein